MAGKSLAEPGSASGLKIFEYLSWSQKNLVEYLKSELDLDQQVCEVFQGMVSRIAVIDGMCPKVVVSFCNDPFIVCSLSLLLDHKIDGSQIPVVSAEMLEKMGIKLVNEIDHSQ